MKQSMKTGFGLMIGLSLGYVTFNVAGRLLLYAFANNESFMERLKVHDPEFYEVMLKHR